VIKIIRINKNFASAFFPFISSLFVLFVLWTKKKGQTTKAYLNFSSLLKPAGKAGLASPANARIIANLFLLLLLVLLRYRSE